MTRDEVIWEMAKAIGRFNAYGPGWTDEAATAALSALESLGIALVPVKPTEAMVTAGHESTDFTEGGFTNYLGAATAKACYAAFLSASPLRKTEGGEE